MSLPNIPNVVSTEELIETAEAIIDWQLPNGMIPWFPGGHSDPWNHVEAAMALAVTGHLDAAEQAYIWLKDNQLPNGAWHHYYLADDIEDPKHDSNASPGSGWTPSFQSLSTILSYCSAVMDGGEKRTKILMIIPLKKLNYFYNVGSF